MWPQCGAGTMTTAESVVTTCVRLSRAKAAPMAAFFPSTGLLFAGRAVDNSGDESLYRASWRAAARRDGASAKPLTVSHGDRASGHDLVAMSDVRASAALPFLALPAGGKTAEGRRGRKVPGCLTSESEERETWTAESLRTASSNGEGLGIFRRERGHGRDFGGLTFQVNTVIAQAIRVGPRQTCDRPRSILFNLRV